MAIGSDQTNTLPVGATSADVSQDDFFRTDHLVSDIRGRSVRGGVITVTAQAAVFFLRMGSTVVLARLLTPADFGLVAMVAALTGFIGLFKDAGLSMATYQREHITHGQVSTLFWVNVGLSFVLMLVTAALAPVIAWFYGEPRLTLITLVVAVTFVLGGSSVQHQALLRRQMRFRQLAEVQVLSLAVGIAAAITVAALTRSYWALVAMQVFAALTTAIYVWIACRWVPGRPRRGTGVMPMLKFGGNVTGYTMVNYMARNIDNVLIGWLWGAAPLGLYSKAYGLLMLPVNQMDKPVSNVMIPALSRVQSDFDTFKRLYFRAVEVMALFVIPGIAILALNAELLVRLVLGEQWLEVVPVFQILAPAALVAVTSPATGWAVLPLGRADKYFRLSIATSVVFILAIIAGLPFGLTGVAIGVTASRLLVDLPSIAYCYQGTGLKVREFVLCLVRPVVLMLLVCTVHVLAITFGPVTSVESQLALLLFELVLTGGLLLSIPSIRKMIKQVAQTRGRSR